MVLPATRAFAPHHFASGMKAAVITHMPGRPGFVFDGTHDREHVPAASGVANHHVKTIETPAFDQREARGELCIR